MSAIREEIHAALSEQAWSQLANLEALHRVIQQNHERVLKSLDEAAVSVDRRELQIAWNQYRAVVADLSQVTEDIESLRLGSG
jgi:predicted Zn-ribbon and HTH transcriptional regulator